MINYTSMKNIVNKKTSAIWVAFIVLSVMIVAGWNYLANHTINPWVVLIANGVLCLVTLLNIAYHTASLQKSNPQAVLRSVMASTMIKFIFSGGICAHLLNSCRSIPKCVCGYFVYGTVYHILMDGN